MALDNSSVNEVLQKLDALNRALESFNASTHKSPLASPRSPPPPITRAATQNTDWGLRALFDVDNLQKGSVFTGEDSLDIENSDDDEPFFVQETLPPESYTDDDFRRKLRYHRWDEHARRILGPVLQDRDLLDSPVLFVDDDVQQDGNDCTNTHATVYEVGMDGAALLQRRKAQGLSQAIWQSLNNTNADQHKKRLATGKITIIREPSPLLFGAIHLTMDPHFAMDNIFRLLANESGTRAYMKGCFDPDPTQQRTFLFCFKYHTIVGGERSPMPWQASDQDLRNTRTHIPISSCASVVALSLSGEPSHALKNRSRKNKAIIGQVFDPFAPWRVLSVQCYPDWKSTVDTHDSNRHYVNGPEAFLVTVLTEYRDAQKRFFEVTRRVNAMSRPPQDFMFNRETRDNLLFEDDEFTYSRRYFWATQTLAVMNDNIQAMINAYKDTFTDDVWSGEHKFIWPGTKDQSARFTYWRKRMKNMRKLFDIEIDKLENIMAMNTQEMKDIKSLKDQLFSGTSVRESREGLRQAEITVQQNRNIKLLTLSTIFFLPLTFVTSIFGMTNMDPSTSFIPFAAVTLAICVPTYILIGAMDSRTGQNYLRKMICMIIHPRSYKEVKSPMRRVRSEIGASGPLATSRAAEERRLTRSLSTYEGLSSRSAHASNNPDVLEGQHSAQMFKEMDPLEKKESTIKFDVSSFSSSKLSPARAATTTTASPERSPHGIRQSSTDPGPRAGILQRAKNLFSIPGKPVGNEKRESPV